MVRIVLALYALLFLVFGLRSLFDPQSILTLLSATDIGTDGIYELRGIYGGVSLGIAIMCGAAAFKPALQRPALYVLLAYMGGYVIARIAAILTTGLPSPLFLAFSAFEAISALIAAGLLWRRSR